MRARFLYRSYKARYRDQQAEMSAALAALHAGDAAVDVGANKGGYLHWLRKAVGPTGRVYAYEPQPSLAAYLESVCQIMKWNNVSVHGCALSDVTGVRILNVPGQGDSPGASLEPSVAERTPCRRYECQVDTLDHQLLGVERVGLLKVDVEGHELQVFRGAKDTLSNHAPAILFECEARHLRQHTMQDVFAFLRSLGYQGAFFSPKGLRPLSEFDANVHQRQDAERFWDAPGYCNNFLFTSRSRQQKSAPLRP
jgi:FkbM family methyltransferase